MNIIKEKFIVENDLVKRTKKINTKYNICLMKLPLFNNFLLISFFKNNNILILECLNELLNVKFYRI